MPEQGLGSMLEKAKDMGSNMSDEAKEKGGDAFHQLESLARENTDESKGKLMEMAKGMGIDVDEHSNIGEIKNKIKDKLRKRAS